MTSKIVVNNIEAVSGLGTVNFNSNIVRGNSNLHSDGLALGAGSTVGAVTGVTTYYGDGSQLTGISVDSTALKDSGGSVKVQANNSGAVVTGILSTGTNSVAIPSIEADILIIGGGGAAGTTGGEGGGGGAGGFQEYNSAYLVKGKVYTVTVGAGGAGTGSYDVRASRGAPSSIKGANLQCMPSAGGGPGATYPAQTPTGKGYGIGGDGASGGGGGGNYNANNSRPMHYGGKGIGGQGTDGGDGMWASGYGGGGGGGAGQAGASGNSSNGNAGDGGDGLQSDITGSNVYYAGGGAGNSTATDGTGGQGGGGDTDNSGTANTGGGAGAGNTKNGGSGVVIIRVLTTDYSGTTSGSPTVTTDGSHKVIKFTGSGTYTA